ncbi:MAG: serine/threonine-protein kinase [Polyangiales bacterium]
MAVATPLTFGRYEALFHIASGGMAEVFAARLRGPAGFEKLVAVKRLLPDLTDEHFVSMFLDEARIAAQISSPHVVQTLELGRAEDDGALYIVMELVVGVTLFDLCVSVIEGSGEVGRAPARPPQLLPIPIVVDIVAQAARGMGDAHDATTPTGFACHGDHRDISPQNLLCGVDGRVRVTDFGIARAVSRSTETQVGQLKGKVAYVSPEQGRGQKLDVRSDVFSLGIVAWEALTGKSLFNTGEAAETLDRVLELQIPSPRALRPDVPEALANAVMWALQRDIDKRCPSAARFERAIREAVPGTNGRALASFVKMHGGPTLERITRKIHEMHDGGEPSVMRKLGSKSKRIVPEAEVSSTRVLGATTAPRSQRELETEEVRPASIKPSKGQALSEAPAGRRRRLGAALAVGIFAWFAAIVVAYFAFSSGPQGPADTADISDP